ncbi:tetratricopeptide repeat protein [soil metagenome]
MVDVFEEVEGELRSERYKQMAIKLAPWVIGGLLAGAILAGGIYAFISYRNGQQAKASEAYAQALTTLQTGQSEPAYRQLAQVPDSTKGYKILALMLQGDIRLQEDKTKEAVALYDKAAAAAPKTELGYIVSDLSRLKSALALLDDAPYSELEARLKPLTEQKRPYSAQARETLAMAKIRAGKLKEARQDLQVLSLLTDAPEAVRNRAKTTVSMIDSGLLTELPALVKAAAALPPMPQITPEMIQAAQAQGAQIEGPPAPGGPQ